MRTYGAMGLACLAMLLAAGCAYSTKTGLPGHIQTVAVPVFDNSTFYKGLESKLTQAIIEKLNQEPRVRVVNGRANATIRGEIVEVTQVVLQQTRQDRPTSVRLVVTVNASIYDHVEDRELIPERQVISSQSSSGVGIYEPERGEVRTTAEDEAIREVADVIVREFVEYWPAD